ncbi:MAG: cytosine-specific methylase [Rhodospirillales bacterium]|nr:cytosine-specific methylase [Rhodospirillales bacterium]
MNGGAYYNENDPYAAAWLRNLIDAGHIAPGHVDERSILDVGPDDLRGFTQCHFFAGIGVWSHALRTAGWPDDRGVWTGSCPCQPFSVAGRGDGFGDQRHLWPAWYDLIKECLPGVVFGEQVASKDALAWFDVVHADLEDADYAVGSADLCAAGVGAPHIRQRLWFVADANRYGPQGCEPPVPPGLRRRPADAGTACGMGDPRGTGLEGCHPGTVGLERATTERTSSVVELAHTNGGHAGAEGLQRGRQHGQQPQDRGVSFWSAADWLPCRDGKSRPVEPGTLPLAHGVTSRVGKLRAYGNAIVAPVAVEFIKSYLEVDASTHPAT